MIAMEKVACVGAGNVGRAWAIVFARAGYAVALHDALPATTQAAMQLLRTSLRDLQQASLIEDADAVLARIEPADTLATATAGVIHVQESAFEDLDVKRALFAQLDALAPPDATLASSTSALPGSDMFRDIPGRHRCLVAHPVNPPYLIPLVELCPTPWTDAAVLTRCRDMMQKIGQRPVTLRREIRGFLLNRLQFALVGECMHLVGEGYCSVEDIDAVLTAGLARRWSFIGPFEVAHLNATEGFKGFMTGLGPMVRSVSGDVQPDYPWDDALVARIHEELARRTPVAEIPQRQAWRDRQLMQIVQRLRDESN
jgi:3-hydroxyacyl-CoA dehydrogenase